MNTDLFGTLPDGDSREFRGPDAVTHASRWLDTVEAWEGQGASL